MVGFGEQAAFRAMVAPYAPKIALAVGAAAIIASSMTVFAGARDLTPRATFAERFVIPTAAADCTLQGWPYFDNRCLHRQDGAPARPVRIIAIDRVSRS
jgi:hypothetical protein